MMKTTRRKFLMGLGLLTGSVMAGKAFGAGTIPATPTAPTASTSPALKGRVHGLGMVGRLFPGQTGRKKGTSIITTIDLASGASRQTPLDMADGHAAMSMEDGRILCVAHHKNKSMVLDAQHEIIKEFISPETHVYGGHGLVFPERNIFIMPMRYAHQRNIKDFGRMQVYDLKTLAKLDELETGGLHPHEVHVIPGKDEIVTTHYGDIGKDGNRKPYTHNVVETKLTILDAKTFKPKRHYPQPEFNAMVTHMRVDKEGWAYYVLTQYIEWQDKKDLKAGEDPFSVAVKDLEKEMGQPITFPIPYQAMGDKKLPVPLPFVRVNTQTGERQIINAGDQYHLRSQSVAYNEVLGKAIGLYYQSDNLVIHSPGKEPEILKGSDLLLTDIRGVTEIPGTTMIAVMGTNRNASVYDLATHKVVNTFQTLNYSDTHLYYDNASV